MAFFAFMRTIFVGIFLIFGQLLFAQKRVDKILDNQDVSTVYINGANCYKIHVIAQPLHDMNIKTRIAGEHNEDMMIATKVKHDTLFVGARFQPLFVADNDKLSAHKVMSIEMEVFLPEHLTVYIVSDIAQVQAQGLFKGVIIELRDGNCVLSKFTGNAKVNTVNGDITVQTNYAKIEAETKSGERFLEPITLGVNELILKSIRGDIKVSKTE